MYTSDKSDTPTTIYLKDYRPPAFLIKETWLDIDLYEESTKVQGELHIYRNPAADAPKDPHLRLNIEQMKVQQCLLDGAALDQDRYEVSEEELTVFDVPDSFVLKTEVEIHPETNTSLMGLYKSRSMFCTQCEAEGFRKITPYLDRPDVLSKFTTRITADSAKYPVLLSNGNLIEESTGTDGRHTATWEDPFLKPSYLFAMVAGDLSVIRDSFVTCSQREIELRIYVEEKDLDKCDHALRSLKSAMRWDEEKFGREYDLDIFMIVAVDDFNMGAMENKGLNIFNTSAVLTNPSITTDQRFQWVEAVVAHEYFHNWSGNRVTCRDWFQLSLKEGFTVYRDSEFSADMNSRTVKRIEAVRNLRAYQFAEDAGPLAHPVQPPAYQEINNFYTQTVYEKGAEVVRMQATLLGPEQFRKATDLYFERFDGQAVTIEDFVSCMAEVSGKNFDQFMNWYRQAGTPRVKVEDEYDSASGTYKLRFSQSCPATPENSNKSPFEIPISLGLVGAQGELPIESTQVIRQGGADALFLLKEPSDELVFNNLQERPVPSLLRDFSAPVKLKYDYSQEQLIQLLKSDSNGFNKWNASQQLAISELFRVEGQMGQGKDTQLHQGYVNALSELLGDDSLDPAMVAMMILLPSMETLVEGRSELDIEAVWSARDFARKQLSQSLSDDFEQAYARHNLAQAYEPTAKQIAGRSLKNIALAYWLNTGSESAIEACKQQFDKADNMTDLSAALSALANSPLTGDIAEEYLATFYERWKHEALAVNQWLIMQASRQISGNLSRVKALLGHPAYDEKNPNKVRALIGGFCTLDPQNFHAADGTGYEFLAEQILRLNRINPQVASRLVTPLTKWKNYSAARSDLMREQLAYIGSQSNLSKDLREVVTKSL